MPSVQAQVSIDVSANSPGSIRVGSSSTTCDASAEGTLQWNGACMQGCDGSSWSCLNGACDNAPTSLAFDAVTGGALNTLTESNMIAMNGVDTDCGALISVSGDGNPEWRLCNDNFCWWPDQDWTNQTILKDLDGLYLQVRTTSPSSSSGTHTVTVNVGSTSDTWTVGTVVTGSCGATPTIGDICPDGTIYAGLTPDGNVPMYLARCDIGMSWSGSACTGTRSDLPWNDDNSSDRTFTGHRNWVTGELNTAGIITVDADSGTVGDQPHQAAQACADLNVHGHTDWYLPALNEMWVIWDNILEGTPDDNNPDPLVTGFDTTSSYWTSTEANDLFTQRAAFYSGSSSQWYGDNKHSDHPVRCARKD